MTIYLYVKTHNKTGLKYLGKTSKQDPHKYTGSGTRWLNHLRKHGYDYNTEILLECQTIEEIKHWGMYYSSLWNVVESSDWANLKPESGDGGVITSEIAIKISNALKGHKRSDESVKKSAEGNKNKIRSDSLKQNLTEKRLGNHNPFYVKNHSDETKLHWSKVRTGKTYIQEKHVCEYCGIKTIKSNIVRWHGVKCKMFCAI